MNNTPLQMTSLVKEICQNIQQQDPAHKLTFQVNDLSDAYGDEEMIKKVWMHLISNAVKFTEKKEVRTIEIGSEEKEGQVVYRIKDNGDGFDMNYYPKLFGVFQRLHHKTDFEGIGIGLASVAKIVSKHKGKAWGEGKVKEGATFYFSLPMQ
jgi:light-regulated signal transduction histidine kinase (bacteriophytochrome)